MDESERIAEGSWDGSASNYSDDQYESACALDREECGAEWASKGAKERCSLPYKTPDGQISRAGTHAAAQRLSSVTDACDKAIAEAKSKLRSAYKSLGEDPPEAIRETEAETVHRDRALADTDGSWVFREEAKAGMLGVLTGHFAVFNRWTDINSPFEGHFMERVAPGAFTKTFTENRKGMQVLLNHGKDPSVGMKPLGPIRDLEQDEKGAHYEVDLLDTSYNRDILPGLAHGLYGASFRFAIVREDFVQNPTRSDYNPNGIPESTITEAKVREFGPVTFPAYEEATAGLRALNDELIGMDIRMMAASDPKGIARFAQILSAMPEVSTLETGDNGGANIGTNGREQRSEPLTPPQRTQTSGAETSKENNAPADRAPDVSRKPYGSTLKKRAAPLRTNRESGEPLWKL